MTAYLFLQHAGSCLLASRGSSWCLSRTVEEALGGRTPERKARRKRLDWRKMHKHPVTGCANDGQEAAGSAEKQSGPAQRYSRASQSTNPITPITCGSHQERLSSLPAACANISHRWCTGIESLSPCPTSGCWNNFPSLKFKQSFLTPTPSLHKLLNK